MQPRWSGVEPETTSRALRHLRLQSYTKAGKRGSSLGRFQLRRKFMKRIDVLTRDFTVKVKMENAATEVDLIAGSSAFN